MKEFLSRNQVPYQWVDLETDAATRELILSMPDGMSRLPVLLFDDGTKMVQPTTREIAEGWGCRRPRRGRISSSRLVVVGGGPAGLAAAVYGASEGFAHSCSSNGTRRRTGGHQFQIENYLGFPNGISGADFARRATIQARRFGAEIISAQDVVEDRRHDPYRIAVLSDGSEISRPRDPHCVRHVVRRARGPGVADLVGAACTTEPRSAKPPATATSMSTSWAGRTLPARARCFFARHAKQVTPRAGADLTASMSRYLIERIKETKNVAVLYNTTVASVRGQDRLQRPHARRTAAARRGMSRRTRCSSSSARRRAPTWWPGWSSATRRASF